MAEKLTSGTDPETPALVPAYRSIARSRNALRAAIDRLLWQDRHRQRRGLAALSDTLLKDIGITRAEAMGESDKWPWRA